MLNLDELKVIIDEIVVKNTGKDLVKAKNREVFVNSLAKAIYDAQVNSGGSCQDTTLGVTTLNNMGEIRHL